jgi:hypothetical protein
MKFLSFLVIVIVLCSNQMFDRNIKQPFKEEFILLELDSFSFPFYYFYKLKNIKNDSLVEVVVKKKREINPEKLVGGITINCRLNIELTQIYSFQISNESTLRIGNSPILFQSKDLKVISINNYGKVYTTEGLFGKWIINQ